LTPLFEVQNFQELLALYHAPTTGLPERRNNDTQTASVGKSLAKLIASAPVEHWRALSLNRWQAFLCFAFFPIFRLV